VVRTCDLVVSTVREPNLTPSERVHAGGVMLMSVASLTLNDGRELCHVCGKH